MSYTHDRKWADTFETQVLSILNTLISHLAVISIAPDEVDKKYATDLVVKLVGGTIAVRLRKPDCKYRDLTIRAHRDNGMKTELAKIKEGYAYRYFYGWTDEKGNIAEWVLVDLDKLRMTNLLDKPSREWGDNHDGTYFLKISAKELQNAGCLISKSERKVNPQVSLTEGIERAKQRSYATSKVEKPQLTDRERNIINSFPVAQEVLW